MIAIVDYGVGNLFSLKSSFAAIGGTLFVDSDNMNITNSTFEYSFALIRGGTIAGNAQNATINDFIINHSVGSGYVDSTGEAYGAGGAIYWENANNLNISNAKILEVESHANGAISLVNCSDSELHNILFHGEITIRDGGSISWINSTNITVDSCTFEATAASYNGGAIFLDNVDEVVVKNSDFNNTSALWGNGGAIYVNGNATFDNNTFDAYNAVDYYA